MSLSERNTPSHGQGAGAGGGSGGLAGGMHRQRPPDVEEALSSMLWTPYERTPLPSSSEEEAEEEDDDERLNRQLRKSHSSYEASALNQPHHAHLPLFAHHQQALDSGSALLLPPVPSFPPFSLSAFDAAIAGFDPLAKVGFSASGVGGRRNRYSFPAYQGSPTRTLTQWCSTAATSIKEPPSYDSLYNASSSKIGAPPATSLILKTSGEVGVALEPCDRSQRSPTKAAAEDQNPDQEGGQDRDLDETESKAAPLTANVPSGLGLRRSFTDDYISQNCDPFTPATATQHNSNTETTATETQSPVTNARSQQSEENPGSSAANCIINEQRDEAATATATSAAAAAAAAAGAENEETSSVAVQVSQPVSCAARERRELLRASNTNTPASSSSSASNISYASNISGERSAISLSATFGGPTLYSASSSNRNCYNSSSSTSSNYRPLYDSSSSSVLRPNKCLAELERLYAEFRASESRFERGLSQCQLDIENANATDTVSEMRLNVPATAAADTVASCSNSSSNSNNNSSSSSVFLNVSGSSSTDSGDNQVVDEARSISNIAVLPAATATATTTTATSKSCQRQPSLTIQVNNNNNNNGNTNGTVNGNRVSVASPTSIVNNNNGVCVVNCSYTPSSSSNNNNSSSSSCIGNTANSNISNNNSVVEINKCVPAAKVFSASVQNQNRLNNNSSCPKGDQQHVAAASTASNNNHVQPDNSVNIISVNASSSNNNNNHPRTFTSTECQTDDLSASTSSNLQQQQQHQIRTREQRRKERRERRQQQQQQQQFQPHHARRHPPPPPPPQLHPPPHLHHPHPHPHPAAMGLARALLPDILHAHYPPPYTALPVPMAMSAAPPQPPPATAVAASAAAAAAQQPALASSAPPPALTSVISTVPLPGPLPAPLMNDGRFTLPLPIMRRSPSERSGKGCCGQWFAGPPLRALIAVVALGGVACALGGAALGATGLAGPPNSHLTAALLMIGVGVVLVTVSGAAWRMTAPGGQSCLGIGLGTSVDLGRCGRRPCSRGGGAPHGLLYPEFQHRPPPPSYQASMQEYRLRLLLLDRDRQNGVVRGNSPPPTYRSHAGSLLRAPLTTLRSGMGGGGGAGGTISSSMGGSEYSLPPSYRSRNATPASLVCSERNIETAPSGRLLANEDLQLPEPSVVEQLPDYTALQSNTLLTSAIVEIESSNRIPERESNATTAGASNGATAMSKSKDLVTIVTISQSPGSTHSQTQTETQNPAGQASALDQIDILAHL
ncbi:serine-rich adhesin for platelets isoform X1 [Drosophila mauritiana]|uniref:Serine-rich adhesin for platelets isoform X1 n=1 Tax=Drosophila mauritiana TaxID=7226 RepID=A0A6P8JNG6_DROMA|nr:serine-rich adhesin for platelets isoform X1 [Drosophila mauritiana]